MKIYVILFVVFFSSGVYILEILYIVGHYNNQDFHDPFGMIFELFYCQLGLDWQADLYFQCPD